ncbi:MAG: hypothetical protein LC803_02170 [Acidobacteria bacterium]|nr:hypothetical protein [Acidobacteriota bacterium]
MSIQIRESIVLSNSLIYLVVNRRSYIKALLLGAASRSLIIMAGSVLLGWFFYETTAFRVVVGLTCSHVLLELLSLSKKAGNVVGILNELFNIVDSEDKDEDEDEEKKKKRAGEEADRLAKEIAILEARSKGKH